MYHRNLLKSIDYLIIMANLFDDLNVSSRLIVDAAALDFDYLPKLLMFRESEQKYIADCIKPLFSSGLGKNVLITGRPGIGKSTACRFVLRDLEEKGLDSQVFPLYVNCWKNNTEHKLLLEICNLLGYKLIYNKTSAELLAIISKMINKKSAVVCLDEIDRLDDPSVLYNLIEEIYKKVIILITNNADFFATLDSRIHSRLVPEIINFKHYNYEETKKILNQRIELAFQKDSFEQDAFEEIAAKSAYEKDIRLGLSLLKESANIAEADNCLKVSKEHAVKAIQKFITYISPNEIKPKIISLLKDNNSLSTQEIMAKLNNPNINYRQVTRIISKLKNENIITTKTLNKGIGGNIPVHSLNQPSL